MRDAAGNICPGGAALIGKLRGDIVKGEHKAFGPAFRCFSRTDAHGQCLCLLAALDAHLPGRVTGLPRLFQQISQFGRYILQHLPAQHPMRQRQQGCGRGIGDADHPFRCDRHDARRHPGQHRFGKAAAGIKLVIGAEQRGLLRLQLAGHAVESAFQHADFIGLAAHWHPHIQIAIAHPFGGAGKARDWRDKAIGQPQGKPDGDDQREQRHRHQDQVEAQLHHPAAFGERIILAQRAGGLVGTGQHGGINLAADIKEGAGAARHANRGFHPILTRADQGDGRGVGAGQIHVGDMRLHFAGRSAAGRHQLQAGGRHAENGGFGQCAAGHLEIEAAAIERRAFAEIAGIAGHVGGHHHDIVADALAVFLNIGMRDLVGAVENGLHPIGKPELHAELEQQRGEHHHQQRWHRGNAGKQRHQAQVQLGNGQALAPVGDQYGKPPADQHHQQHRRDQTGHQHQRHQRLRRTSGRHFAAGEQRIAGPAHDDGGRRRQHFKPWIEIIVAGATQHPAQQPPPAQAKAGARATPPAHRQKFRSG